MLALSAVVCDLTQTTEFIHLAQLRITVFLADGHLSVGIVICGTVNNMVCGAVIGNARPAVCVIHELAIRTAILFRDLENAVPFHVVDDLVRGVQSVGLERIAVFVKVFDGFRQFPDITVFHLSPALRPGHRHAHIVLIDPG